MKYLTLAFAFLSVFYSGCSSCSQEEKPVNKVETPTPDTTTTTHIPEQETVVEEPPKNDLPDESEVNQLEDRDAETEIAISEEERFAPFIDASSFITIEGDEVPMDFEYTLASDAAEDIVIYKEGTCEKACGKKFILENYNEDKEIEVAVRITYKEDKQKLQKVRIYKVEAGEKKWIGCSEKCSSTKNVSVKWVVISARYAS